MNKKQQNHNLITDCIIDAITEVIVYKSIYQLPFLLTAALHDADKHCLSHGMCIYQVMMTLHFLNDVANDAESTQKIDLYVTFASLKSDSTW